MYTWWSHLHAEYNLHANDFAFSIVTIKFVQILEYFIAKKSLFINRFHFSTVFYIFSSQQQQQPKNGTNEPNKIWSIFGIAQKMSSNEQFNLKKRKFCEIFFTLQLHFRFPICEINHYAIHSGRKKSSADAVEIKSPWFILLIWTLHHSERSLLRCHFLFLSSNGIIPAKAQR